MANPHVILRGNGVPRQERTKSIPPPDLSRLEIRALGAHRWTANAIPLPRKARCAIGDKVGLRQGTTSVNTYLDIEIGASTLVADWCYICDFDHRMDDINTPIKDQGIVKGPVRIGPDTWVAAKVTVLRNTRVGRGCVPRGARRSSKGDIPDYQHRGRLAREGGQEPQVRLGRPALPIARSTSRRSKTSRARRPAADAADASSTS